MHVACSTLHQVQSLLHYISIFEGESAKDWHKLGFSIFIAVITVQTCFSLLLKTEAVLPTPTTILRTHVNRQIKSTMTFLDVHVSFRKHVHCCVFVLSAIFWFGFNIQRLSAFRQTLSQYITTQFVCIVFTTITLAMKFSKFLVDKQQQQRLVNEDGRGCSGEKTRKQCNNNKLRKSSKNVAVVAFTSYGTPFAFLQLDCFVVFSLQY